MKDDLPEMLPRSEFVDLDVKPDMASQFGAAMAMEDGAFCFGFQKHHGHDWLVIGQHSDIIVVGNAEAVRYMANHLLKYADEMEKDSRPQA